MSKPKVNSAGEAELEKVEKQLDDFNTQVKDLTQDRMNATPKVEHEPINKLSSKEIEKSPDVYIKPSRSVSDRSKFNEKFRDDYNFAKEYVKIIAENREVIGETLEFWTRPFAGMPAEFWIVPVGKPVWVPRYVAERIKGCTYHRLSMQDRPTSVDGMGTYLGTMVVDNIIQRLDAHPADQKRKSIFMGSSF